MTSSPGPEMRADDLSRQLSAQIEDIIAPHQSGDVPGAWKRFFVLANIALPDGVLEQMFGGERDPQDLADDCSSTHRCCAPPPAGARI
jgi:hypothetical protein